MTVSINVFVSYSWAMEKDTKIVDELDRLCQQRGIKLIRDNKTLKHGDLIKQFMDKLTKGDHVITVFSKPYFESKWCMYELLRIYQRGDFEQRTHPVIADDCDLQDRAYRLGLVSYWQKQHEKVSHAIKGHQPELVVDEIKDVKIYRDIYQNINGLVNFAAARLTTPLAELQKQNYTQLLDRIKLAEKKPFDADEQHKQYLAKLPQRINKQLEQLKDSSLYQALASEFITDGSEPSPANLWQAIESKINDDPISLLEQYRNSIAVALKNDLKHINEAQTLFLLFLGFFSKSEDVAAAHQVHQLPVRTRLAVEIYLAARYGLTPDLVYEPQAGLDVNQSARGRFAIDGDTLFREVGWDVKAHAKELAETTHIAVNKVHDSVHGQKPAEALDEFGLESLNETIKTRRQGEYPQLIRLEVPSQKSSEPSHPLHNDDVCALLLDWLPNLPIARYGSESAKTEPKLCAQVNEFFSIIKHYSQAT